VPTVHKQDQPDLSTAQISSSVDRGLGSEIPASGRDRSALNDYPAVWRATA
jgi:hypothetical protein